jgi:hypothetical protein
MGHPQVKWSVQLMTHNGVIPAQFQGDREGRDRPPLNPMECGLFRSVFTAKIHAASKRNTDESAYDQRVFGYGVSHF